MTVNMTHTVSITGSETRIKLEDLRALVNAAEEVGVPMSRDVQIRVQRGDQRDPGSSTLTLSLAP